ncbi:MAG TPA: hypothetical protein VIG55_11655 [Methylosinus sp.]|jgi:hypothetical protein
MRRCKRRSNHPGLAAVGRRGLARVWRAGTMALALVALLIVSVAPRAMAETGARVGAGVGVDCLSHDLGHSSGGPSQGACHLGGPCCVSECPGGAPPDCASARVSALRRRFQIVARAFAARGDRLCLAGWASAWSSRAPPRRS